MVNTYYRLILSSEGQTTYSSPVYNNLNFPDLSPYRFCKVFVESCGLAVAEEDGGAEQAHSFISIEVVDYASNNTQICSGVHTSNSNIVDIIGGIKEQYTAGNDVIKCNKNKSSDIDSDGCLFPINILQNNCIKLNIRYADDTLIVAPATPLNVYKIILGIQLIS